MFQILSEFLYLHFPGVIYTNRFDANIQRKCNVQKCKYAIQIVEKIGYRDYFKAKKINQNKVPNVE